MSHWPERQRAMLQAMGVALPLPAAPTAPATPTEAAPAAPPVAAAVARPVPAPAPAPAPDARAAHIHTLAWPALREAVAGCTACGLCEGRRHTVFGVGHPNARWMIVGEAPGEQEDLQGEPFVGAAGQLLDKMLAALGLTRAEAVPERQVYIANTLKCRPPRNRNPEPAELAACEPYLRRQLALVQPQVLLAMGRFAVQTLLGSTDAIGKLRGRVHRVPGLPPLVVTYHPAYLLRSPAEKAKSWADLCLAAQVMQDAG